MRKYLRPFPRPGLRGSLQRRMGRGEKGAESRGHTKEHLIFNPIIGKLESAGVPVFIDGSIKIKRRAVIWEKILPPVSLKEKIVTHDYR